MILDLEPIRERLAAAEHTPADITALIDEVEQLRTALDTVGSAIYAQGSGMRFEQRLLAFIREKLGRT